MLPSLMPSCLLLLFLAAPARVRGAFNATTCGPGCLAGHAPAAVTFYETAQWDGGYGEHIALSVDTLAVGHPKVGRVYVYARQDSAGNWSWSAAATLDGQPRTHESFGDSVSLSGETLAVQGYSPLSHDPGVSAGTVSVYSRNSAGSWGLTSTLELEAGQRGRGIALSEDTLAQVYGGNVRVYSRDSAGKWVPAATIEIGLEGLATEEEVVHSIALSGQTLAIGVPTASAGDRDQAGQVRVYALRLGDWVEVAQPEGEGAGAAFGCSVALSGDTLAVGAKSASPANTQDGDLDQAGLVYVFARNTQGE
jgi:hypothetical protein